MLVSWLEAREIQSRSHSEAAVLPPSVNPAQTALGKAKEENGLQDERV